MKPWIEALRLRTLPLSVAGVLVAAGLALHFEVFSLSIFISMLVMVLLLQIVSNFADEYGDLEHGVDNESRVGPKRGMQRGEITREEMKRALIITSVLVMLSALVLSFISFGSENWLLILAFAGVAVLCIVGAVKYTVGRHAYGYVALGDLSCFFFFGLMAVCGGFFLYAHALLPVIFLPAVGLGCLVTGMLNLNNIRDYENDKACGKRTFAVLLGRKGARIYQGVLLVVGMGCLLSFSFASDMHDILRYAYVLLYVPFAQQLIMISTITEDADFDHLMKPHSLTTAALALAFSLCIGV
ncbi:MAG: 1,4-dihydroxy-2-naphthoate octaprenyltransferase [Actinobacteria bacterium]|nr:1,4-dihydroxy-2-naphthoate octaprenyltransferase [Actinomycetota bacterium]